ncbi:MAG: CvpA family protein [Acholeplasmatales bacterium]|nr:CvpA family protein [Acholeplasmatales bacterium]
MDLGFCGLMDVIIVGLAIVAMFIGYLKGFIHKFVVLVGIISAILLGIFFCTSFAYIMKDWGWFYPGIHSSIDGAISPNFSSPDINMETLTEALGGNSFMAWIILSITHPTTVPEVVEAITMLIMKCIAFGIIFLGTFVIIIILVIVAKVLRKSKGVRVIDGILGMVFSLVIYTATVSLLLFFLNLIYKYAGWTDLNNWLDVDMQLTTDSFRLSKWLFNGNLFTFIVSLFQPK